MSGDLFLRANCAAGTVTFNLPAVGPVIGNTFIFKKVDSSANNMIIAANGGDLIDGVSSVTSNTQYESFSLISNGISWDLY